MTDLEFWSRLEQEVAATMSAMQIASNSERDFLQGKLAALLLAQYANLGNVVACNWAEETWFRLRKELSDAPINQL